MDMAPGNSNPSLLVVIVNYRTPDLTIECLRSLENEIKSLGHAQVAVVDNESGDDSAEKLSRAIQTENWSDWATFTPSGHNGGFAYGNNVAIRPALASEAPPDYVLLLNPDTVIRPGALRVLLEFMQENPEVGIAGSRLEEADETPQCSAFRFHTLMSELDSSVRFGLVSKLLKNWVVWPAIPEEASQAQWVAGASMMIRRQVFEKIGLMDESYFMYYEEMDFCLQAKRAGWSCWYVPQSRVVHYVGQSSGVTDTKKPPKRLPQYWFDSRRRYFLKNYGWAYTALADAAWLTGFTSWRLRRAIQRKPDPDPPKLWGDFLRNSFFLRGATISAPKIS